MEGTNPLNLDEQNETAILRQQLALLEHERAVQLQRLRELNKIGVALSTEKNPDRLLDMILQKSREITSADAGSLYLVEGDEESNSKRLRFKIAQNDSVDVNYEEFTIPISTESIAGYVASTGQSLNIPNVYAISGDCPYHFNRRFDESTGYHTICMLAVPMRNHQGEIVGIIQLINKKVDFQLKLTEQNDVIVQAFDQSDEELVSSLASQAAVALENSRLIKSIERLFEGFVTAAVTAIESRDPTTSGHSFRVAELTVGLAEVVHRVDIGRFRDIRFHPDEVREMRYAALLHDFGKVGVRENVLIKAKKLYPMQLALIGQRLEYVKAAWKAEFYRTLLDLKMNSGPVEYEREAAETESRFHERENLLTMFFEWVQHCNEPTVLAEGNFERLHQIALDYNLIPPGVQGPLLTPDEIKMLSIRKGSLNERERIEIESHVTHTFLFLSKIPWTKELKEIPRIAYGHHEKLDGSGYPNKIKAEDIPVQTRIMTISDIYDALTAADRPYKRAVKPERALDIMHQDVKSDRLDKDLFQLFVEAKVFKNASATAE